MPQIWPEESTMGTVQRDNESMHNSSSKIIDRKADVENRLVDGIFDNIQVYNIPKFDGFHKRAQPKVLQNNIGEIEKFSRVRFFIGHGYRAVF
jgi:hypothetical protein